MAELPLALRRAAHRLVIPTELEPLIGARRMAFRFRVVFEISRLIFDASDRSSACRNKISRFARYSRFCRRRPRYFLPKRAAMLPGRRRARLRATSLLTTMRAAGIASPGDFRPCPALVEYCSDVIHGAGLRSHLSRRIATSRNTWRRRGSFQTNHAGASRRVRRAMSRRALLSRYDFDLARH